MGKRRKKSKSRQVVAKLNIQKTEDPPSRADYVPRTKPRTSKLGICRFWAALFEANESRSKRRKMTDEEIKRQVLLEFPIEDQPERTQSALRKLGAVGEKGSVTVNYYRNLYNKGKLTGGVRPEVQSQRYNLEGEIVNGRSGRIPASC